MNELYLYNIVQISYSYITIVKLKREIKLTAIIIKTLRRLIELK